MNGPDFVSHPFPATSQHPGQRDTVEGQLFIEHRRDDLDRDVSFDDVLIENECVTTLIQKQSTALSS